MTEKTEPPHGSVVELGEPSLQAGWCYQRVDVGWVRVFRSGRLDRGHVIDWDVLMGHGAEVVTAVPYVAV